MRILHVITSLHTGGAEKLMVDLLPRLKQLGNHIDLLLFDGTKTLFYEKINVSKINIYSLSVGGNVYNPTYIFKLKKYLKQYDIVHTHNTACQYYVALAKWLFNLKCKIITTEHSTSNKRRNICGFKRIDRFIYSRYNKIISISKQATDNIINYLGIICEINTIENGVCIEKYLNLPNNINIAQEIIITMIAGFREAKDQDTLIKAMASLPDKYKLWLIGDGERRKDIENLILKLNLNKRITLFGIRSDIPEILSQSHIVVLSSHWEGLSLSSIEGMASGRPFIASDVDGLHDVVSGAGILFPHQNAQQLAYEIEHLANDNNYYNHIVERCQKRASKYDINIMAKKYNNIYHDILS